MKRILFIIIAISLVSCQKEFLALKPEKSLLVPKTLADFRALLDNTFIMNKVNFLNWIACDDMTTNDAGWLAFTQAQERNSYIWKKDIFEGSSNLDWNACYEQIFYANVVLEGLSELNEEDTNGPEYDAIKGAALFHRAFALYNLSQQFAEPYNPKTASAVKGLPIRLTADINDKPGRGTLDKTYAQIISDLENSAGLLPDQKTQKTRPSKGAALACLARVLLTMQDYQKALQYAEKALSLNNELLDYNVSAPYSFPNGNVEVIFHAGMITGYSYTASTLVGAAPDLIESYDDNDLRKTGFFLKRSNGFYWFRGNYSLVTGPFQGLATDETYLIKAECLARLKMKEEAMTTLNQLMIKRWNKDHFIPFSANSDEEVLRMILNERRKELVCRNTRWSDLRRLNQDPNFQVTVTRVLEGQTYTLMPNDKRYTYPIPDNEINGSGIAQNER